MFNTTQLHCYLWFNPITWSPALQIYLGLSIANYNELS